MSLLVCCPVCTEQPTPLESLSHHPTHLRCRSCRGEWFSARAMEQKVSLEYFKRAVMVLENQESKKPYPCLVCNRSEALLHSIYPSFRFPDLETHGIIPKPNPRWTNIPSYLEMFMCPFCHGAWLKADDVQKLPTIS